MDPLDALWHLLGFLYPAASVGAITAGAAKLLWRQELKAVPWLGLAVAGAAAGAAVLVAGLVAFGHDGRMATYLAMVLACAGALWWRGFRR